MTRYEMRAVVRGRERRLGLADTAEDAERTRAAFEAAVRAPVEVVAIEQLPDDEKSWRAEAA
ncbi:hypothetical protein [Micromonospora maritima]|uniref:hypothetical protein n=1 Tax=Micromonospora maritima TaxID=986711 RepID=UPI00157C5CC2|nr:hypothetical protein [Micromonospora maritima]